MSMKQLKELLDKECDYRMEPQTMEMFMATMTHVTLRNKEPLIPYDKFDDNIYIVAEGIIRYTYFDGTREKTFAFAAPGSLVIAYHSYYAGRPSYFQLESCGQSLIMKVAKTAVDEMTRQSVDFAMWLSRMSFMQLYAWEKKAVVINGTARERFEALITKRPEIAKRVSNRVMASYIGVEESYLSRLKREILGAK